MKTIKVCSDQIRDAKIIGKPIEIFGEQFACVNCPQTYMNSETLVYSRRVVHVKTGKGLPLRGIHYKAPAKDFLADAQHFLNNIGEAAIKAELKLHEILNS